MANSELITVSEERLRKVVNEETRAAVRQTFLTMGVRTDEPGSLLDMQKDFQHLRFYRILMENVRQKGVLIAIGLLVTGIGTAIWAGLKQLLQS